MPNAAVSPTQTSSLGQHKAMSMITNNAYTKTTGLTCQKLYNPMTYRLIVPGPACECGVNLHAYSSSLNIPLSHVKVYVCQQPLKSVIQSASWLVKSHL